MARDPEAELIAGYAATSRVTTYLLEALHPSIWRARAADGGGGGAKTIAALAAHIHNSGLRYLARTSPGTRVPGPLDRHRVTQAEAIRALQRKRAAVLRIVGGAMNVGGPIVGFSGGPVRYLLYYMVHDAHHRGQIMQQARRLGRPIGKQVMIGMWQWPRRARE